MGAPASPSGSRPSDGAQEVSTLTGFDPSRMDANWLVNLLSDYGGGYDGGREFCDSKTFHKRYPEFVAARDRHKAQGDKPSEAMCATLIEFADAIATETRRAETTGSVEDEGAGPKVIAQ